MLETGTIVGPSTEKLRVAKTTVERTFVGKYDHALYFCPQLYKLDSDQKLVPLTGEEIGYILVQQLQNGVVEKRPWYEPSDKLPGQPVVAESSATDFGTLVIDAQRLQPVAIAKKNAPAKGLAT